MKSVDIRSESAVKLIAEFLDMDMDRSGGVGDRKNAEHFTHGKSYPFLPLLYFIKTDAGLLAQSFIVIYGVHLEI